MVRLDSVIKKASLIVLTILAALVAVPLIFKEPYFIHPFLAIIIAISAIMFYIMGVAIERGNQ